MDVFRTLAARSVNDLRLILDAASFAAMRHSGQFRKGTDAQPYINHPLEVAWLLADVGGIDDPAILAAALLHDTIEDTETTADELRERFGDAVAETVLEVTDEEGLSEPERRRRQTERAPNLSPGAKVIKLADKLSNVTELIDKPPTEWSTAKRLGYIKWAEEVVAGLRGVNDSLEKRFDEVISKAKTLLESHRDND